MSYYIRELLLEAKLLLDVATIRELFDFLNAFHIFEIFDEHFRPQFGAHIRRDIPDLHELQDFLQIAIGLGTDSEAFANIMANLPRYDHEKYLAAASVLAYIMATTSTRDDLSDTVYFDAYMILKLLDAMWKYIEMRGEDVAWNEFLVLDEDDLDSSDDSQDSDYVPDQD